MFKNSEGHEFIFGSYPRILFLNSNKSVTDSKNIDDSKTNLNFNMDSGKVLDTPGAIEIGSQIMDLKRRLEDSENEKEELQRKLVQAIDEKERSVRRLEVMASAHENRITEMHCVIAELNKKLQVKKDAIIVEESEADGSEFSFQAPSAFNSDANVTNPDTDCEMELVDMKTVGQHQTNKNQLEILQEEVLHLKAQIAYLESQIASKGEYTAEIGRKGDGDDSISRNDSNSINIVDNKSNKSGSSLKNDKIISNLSQSQEVFVNSFGNNSVTKVVRSNSNLIPKEFVSHKEKPEKIKICTSDVPVSKMAERVKLKRTTEQHYVTGSDLLNSEINKTEIVEHLVSDMILSENLITDSVGPLHFQNEVQRLQRRIEYLKIKNSVLSLTLEECKEHCERLYLLCGKYESNATALQLALNCSDRAIEAYDVMLALLESKLVILKENSLSAKESRKNVEAVARHLLDRFESEKNVNENSLGPWQNTVCINNSEFFEPWTQQDDDRLRNHVSKLKGKRSAAQNTVVIFESPFYNAYDKVRIESDKKEIRQGRHPVDLEMAVLMQELVTLRGDLVESKRKMEIAEKEKTVAIEKVQILQDILSQLQSRLTDSETLLTLATKDRSSYSEAEHAVGIERQLVEALARESQLKKRIQTLIGPSSFRKVADEKYTQVQNNLIELQKENINLSHSLEEYKTKYQTKIKSLEQKIVEMSALLGDQSYLQELVPETTL